MCLLQIILLRHTFIRRFETECSGLIETGCKVQKAIVLVTLTPACMRTKDESLYRNIMRELLLLCDQTCMR
jgi:hypothetical protein